MANEEPPMAAVADRHTEPLTLTFDNIIITPRCQSQVPLGVIKRVYMYCACSQQVIVGIIAKLLLVSGVIEPDPSFPW